jgi:hypothetical protein
MSERIDLLGVFDYALSNGEIKLGLEHDKSGHESDDHPCCPVCRDDMIGMADKEDSNE